MKHTNSQKQSTATDTKKWQPAAFLPVMLMAVLTVSAVIARPPLPVDETRYLGVAWEMYESGNYLVPHQNG